VAVLCGFAGQGSVMPVLALLMGGAVAAIPAKQLQNRWDLIRFGALGGLAQTVTMLGISLLEPVRSPEFGTLSYPQLLDIAYGFVNPIGCSLLLLGSLPLIEYAFGTVTNIRLMELSDQNQPALRRIMIDAPGTWAHTLQVASLCEPAAEAIGANPRLVRTGVYYHDLGKTLKPEYYVENQQQAELLHRRLSPTVSTLIILSHVKDGKTLAEEYGLPPQITAFIPEHHGTTLIKYFYHQAKAKAKEEGREEEVQEDLFRYPGPKPQSRETAIVMLADTAEAASRTLDSPSATRLRSFIHEMIMQKMLDGQLDECDLTFRELEIVEETFVRVLISRFHNRIRYPGQEPEPTQTMPAVTEGMDQKDISSAMRQAMRDESGQK
jgi:putative nucleotidyltransferase with HDIG domain